MITTTNLYITTSGALVFLAGTLLCQLMEPPSHRKKRGGGLFFTALPFLMAGGAVVVFALLIWQIVQLIPIRSDPYIHDRNRRRGQQVVIFHTLEPDEDYYRVHTEPLDELEREPQPTKTHEQFRRKGYSLTGRDGRKIF
ncbi:MAG: hypothetical protein KDD02_14510 [Phaeodactylibacter sp.]|nr:hypothetical protein [Phaeodactylibacter sp.]MCB9302666.1 hypothetical protein [Lewinellaceae bacterium]